MRLRSREVLRARMTEQGVSLGALARAAGVHRSFVTHLLAGRCKGATPPIAQLIASALDVPLCVVFEAPCATSDCAWCAAGWVRGVLGDEVSDEDQAGLVRFFQDALREAS